MLITSLSPSWDDIEQGLSIQPRNLGAAIVGIKAAVDCWKRMARDPFFASIVVEAAPEIKGHRYIGFGASVFLSRSFVDAELAAPRPDINSRFIASVCAGRPTLASRREVARANAMEGIDILILYGSCWRDELLNPAESVEVQTILASNFTEWHAGYKIGRILCETAHNAATEHVERSIVFKKVSDFPEHGRALHMMSRESVAGVSATLGNILFTHREPVLHLRESDQQVLLAALRGATDQELSDRLGITFPAVKARWRSAFGRIAEAMPDLLGEMEDHGGRGLQKRHRILAYLRAHPEELRPFFWGRHGPR
jgi:hypothetical protein